MKEKLLRYFIYFSGFICLYTLLAIRSRPLYNLVMKEKSIPGYWDNNIYGELYYFNNIRYFREDIPAVKRKFQFTEKHPSLEEAQIFTFGDSFLDFSRQKQISERLNDRLKLPVYHEYNIDPLEFFMEENYQNDKPKILLFVRTERWIPLKFSGTAVAELGEENILEVEEENEPSRSKWRDYLTGIRKFLFNERADKLLKRAIQRSYVVSELNSIIATLKFDLFGYVSSFTPEYHIEPGHPWLFFVDQLNDEPSSFYYQHSEQEMNQIGENIKQFNDELWEKYMIKLVVLPVPAKYTIYHEKIDPHAEYNDFLPRLYEELEERNISYVDLYKPYQEAEEYTFWGTDEHWTEEGVEIATKEAIEVINQIRGRASFQNDVMP